MAHFALLWKARIIEKCRLEYEQEKINSVIISKVDLPKKSMMQKWSQYSYDTRQRLMKKVKYLCPEGSSISNFFIYLKTDQTFPNFLMKSVIGFIGGIVLTYLCFMFFVFQLSISLMHATIMSSIIGVLLTLGLAFSYRVPRFLLIPQFFSRVGRYTLTCYALVLILTGPATNTLKNSEVLSESMACSQEQIKSSVKHITDSIKNPCNSMKDWIKVMTEGIKNIAVKLKATLVSTHRMVIGIANVLESSFPWLNSVTKKCNNKLDTPFQHCSRELNKGITNCKKNLNSELPWFCNATYLINVACRSMRPYRRIFEIADYTRSTIVATMKRKFKEFSSRVQSLFFVKVHVHHSYSFSSNASRSASQVAAGIVTEIRNRADPLLTWLSWSSCVTSLFLLLIIFRAKYYQHMYETRSRFDNRYITKELRNLDFKRLKEGKETILPLNRREKAKYITTTSFRLLASERVYLTRSVVFMVITTFKLLVHMVADYSLYWVLMTIRYHGRFQTPLQPGPTDAGVQISGTGPVAEMLRSLIAYLTLPLSTPLSSPVTCLPNPYPPDLQRYTQIGVLIILLWFFALFEPYGLRLRHVIMGHYSPERAKARALWLYNHILRTRGGFMKFARRKLHKEYKYFTGDELTFVTWLDNHLPCWWLRYLLGTLPKEPSCLLCGITEEPTSNNSDTELIRCDTPKCPGTYCVSCFHDMGQLCTVCLSPADYGDMSDISLEKDSSEDSNSDDPESDDQEPVENYECSKTVQNFFGRHHNIDEKLNLLPKTKYDAKNELLLFQRKNHDLDEHLSVFQYAYDEDVFAIKNNKFYRKANMVRHIKHSKTGSELLRIQYKVTHIGMHDRIENTPDTCPYCQEKIHDEIFETESKCSRNYFMQKLKPIRRIFSESLKENNKDVHRFEEQCSGFTDFEDNFKYKRKNKTKERHVHSEMFSQTPIKYQTRKISKTRFREVNLQPKNSRLLVPPKLIFRPLKNIAGYILKPFLKFSANKLHSNYYEIKLSTYSVSVSKIVESDNRIAFRRRRREHRENCITLYTNKKTCSFNNYFFQPRNVSSYCKNLCFKKSTKNSDSNSKSSFSNKKPNKRSEKKPKKEKISKKTDPDESNDAGNGDKSNEEKPENDNFDNRSTCYCMKRIRRLCFCRYTNIAPCTMFKKMFGKNSTSCLSNTINHKRRKKDRSDTNIEDSKENDIEENNEKAIIERNNEENARIYRISAYFGHQEWMKGQFSKSNNSDSKKAKLLHSKSINSLHKLKSGSRKIDAKESIKVKVKKCKEKKKDLIKNNKNADKNNDGTGNEIKRSLDKTKAVIGNENKTKRRSISTLKWFERYSSVPTTSSFSLKTIMKPKKTENSISTEYCMSKSLRYYCSIGNTEFDQIDNLDECKTNVNKEFKKDKTVLLSLKADSENSLFHDCCCSVEDVSKRRSSNLKRFSSSNPGASSVTFNFKTEFDLLSRPVRNIKLKSVKHAMSDRFLHMRLRNPFPLVRDFYSNLLDVKMRKSYDKSKGVQDGKSKAVAVHPRRRSVTCQCESESHEHIEEGNDCPNEEFSNSAYYERAKPPTLDSACETGELLIQPQYKVPQKEDHGLQHTPPTKQTMVESSQTIQRKEFAITTQTTLNLKNEPNINENCHNETPNQAKQNQNILERVNRAVEMSQSFLHITDRITVPITFEATAQSTVGPGNFAQTVFRPSEHGTQPQEVIQPQTKKVVASTTVPAPKKLEYSNSTTPTYTPRKMPTYEGSRRDSVLRPYVFRPAHNEDNNPEDPTLPAKVEIRPAGPCAPVGRRSTDEADPRQSIVKDLNDQPNDSCTTIIRDRCLQDSDYVPEPEPKEEGNFTDQGEDFDSGSITDLNGEDYEKNVVSPKCVFKLPQSKPVPCPRPEDDQRPSVPGFDEREDQNEENEDKDARRESMGMRDCLGTPDKQERRESQARRDSTGRRESTGRRDSVFRRESAARRESAGRRESTGRRESLGRRDSGGRRQSTGRRESAGIRDGAGMLENQTKRESLGLRENVRRQSRRESTRMSESQPRRQSQERRESLERKENQERLERLKRQEILEMEQRQERRESQFRDEKQRMDRPMSKFRLKFGRRSSDTSEAGNTACECSGKRPFSKSISTNVESDSDALNDDKKSRKSKRKTKNAVCQCPPSTNMKLPRSSKIKADMNLSSANDSGTDENQPPAPKYNSRGRTSTRLVPRPVPSGYPRASSRTIPKTRSATWNVQSEGELGKVASYENTWNVNSSSSRSSTRASKRKYLEMTANNDCCQCEDKPILTPGSSHIACNKSSCCTCPPEKRQSRAGTRYSRSNRRSSARPSGYTDPRQSAVPDQYGEGVFEDGTSSIGESDLSQGSLCDDDQQDMYNDQQPPEAEPPAVFRKSQYRNSQDEPITSQRPSTKTRKSEDRNSQDAPMLPSSQRPSTKTRRSEERNSQEAPMPPSSQRPSTKTRRSEERNSQDVPVPSSQRPSGASRRSDIRASQNPPYSPRESANPRQSAMPPSQYGTPPDESRRPSQRSSRKSRKSVRPSIDSQLAGDAPTSTARPSKQSRRYVSVTKDRASLAENQSPPPRQSQRPTQLEPPVREENESSSNDMRSSPPQGSADRVSGLTVTIRDNENQDHIRDKRRPSCLESSTPQGQKQSPDALSSQVETDEIKGYLRSLCRNCQCGKSLFMPPSCVTSQAQYMKLWSPQNDSNELRGYLQSTWRNCQCGKSRPREETVNMSINEPTQSQVIKNRPTQVGAVDIKASMLSMCKNCQCIKRKLFLESNPTLKADNSLLNQQDRDRLLNLPTLDDICQNQDRADNRSCMETSNLNNKFPSEPPFEDICQNPDCCKNKPYPGASALLEELQKSATTKTAPSQNQEKFKDKPCADAKNSKTSCPDTPPMFEIPPIKIEKETQKQKEMKNFSQSVAGKPPQTCNKRVSTSTRRQPRLSRCQRESIQAHESEERCSREEPRRSKARPSQVRSDSLADDSRQSRTQSKNVSDVSQSFPEKLSCGVEKCDTAPVSPVSSNNGDQRECNYRPLSETQQKGCASYSTITEDSAETDKCFPHGIPQMSKKSSETPQPVPEKLPRLSERRTTVHSRGKTNNSEPSVQSADTLLESRKTVRIDDQSPTPLKIRTKIIEIRPKDSKESKPSRHICECKKGNISKMEKRDSTICECDGSKNATECACSPKSGSDTKLDSRQSKQQKRLSSPQKTRKSSLDPLASKPKIRSPSVEQQLSPIRSSSDQQVVSKQKLSNSTIDKRSQEVKSRDRRTCARKQSSVEEQRPSLKQLKTSLSDSLQSLKLRVRSSSNESRPSRLSRRSTSRENRTCKGRNKSAPGDYRPSEDLQSSRRPSSKPMPTPAEIERRLTTKSESPREVEKRDAAVEIRCPICTCATQCHDTSCYRHTAILRKNAKENIYEDIPTPDYTIDDDETLFSDFTSDEISETTLQSTVHSRVAAVEFCDKIQKNRRVCRSCNKRLSKEIKKTNQGTATDRCKLKDVSTVTKDWWSPMCERKKKSCCKKKKFRKTSDKSICTEGRLVTFRSRTQVIPTCCRDILSPSRYLLESQRHYNEIFSTKFVANAVYPAWVHHQRQGGFCASKIKRNSQRDQNNQIEGEQQRLRCELSGTAIANPPAKRGDYGKFFQRERHKSCKLAGHKTKRREDYSPKRQASPRLNDEHARSDDTTRTALLRYVKGLRRHKNRNDAKLYVSRKPRCHKQAYDCAGHKILRNSQQNLNLRFLPADDSKYYHYADVYRDYNEYVVL